MEAGSSDQVLYAFVAYVYARAGYEYKTTEILNYLLAFSESEHIAPFHIAVVYSGLGRTDEMFEWLEKCYAEGGGIEMPMDFGEYRDDPRYIGLCRRIGIPLDE